MLRSPVMASTLPRNLKLYCALTVTNCAVFILSVTNFVYNIFGAMYCVMVNRAGERLNHHIPRAQRLNHIVLSIWYVPSRLFSNLNDTLTTTHGIGLGAARRVLGAKYLPLGLLINLNDTLTTTHGMLWDGYDALRTRRGFDRNVVRRLHGAPSLHTQNFKLQHHIKQKYLVDYTHKA